MLGGACHVGLEWVSIEAMVVLVVIACCQTHMPLMCEPAVHLMQTGALLMCHRCHHGYSVNKKTGCCTNILKVLCISCSRRVWVSLTGCHGSICASSWP